MLSQRYSVLFLLLIVLVSSCATVGKLTTPSTKPEVTISNASKETVVEALVGWSAAKGRQVIATTPHSLTTTGQMDVSPANSIFGDISAVARTIYTPVVKGEDVTIYSQRFITYTEERNRNKHYGSSKPSVSVTTIEEKDEEYNTQRAFEEMQAELEDFAKFFATQRATWPEIKETGK